MTQRSTRPSIHLFHPSISYISHPAAAPIIHPSHRDLFCDLTALTQRGVERWRRPCSTCEQMTRGAQTRADVVVAEGVSRVKWPTTSLLTPSPACGQELHERLHGHPGQLRQRVLLGRADQPDQSTRCDEQRPMGSFGDPDERDCPIDVQPVSREELGSRVGADMPGAISSR